MEIKGKYNSAQVFTDTPDSNTMEQVRGITDQPYAKGAKIRIMPDCHAGAGCVIGTTMTITDKIVPNLVGVDIGCAVKVVILDQPVDVKMLDRYIRKEIPSGFNNNGTEKASFDKVNDLRCIDEIKKVNYNLALGSLGGGNHFIEVNKLDDKFVLVIHSGSRNLGKQVAELYQAKAVAQCRDNGVLLNKELCYLTGSLKEDYLHDMAIVQKYAVINRATMAGRIASECVGTWLEDCEGFETIHNYIDLEANILRKGAVSAKKGEMLVIPINMRDGSLICVGKGNDDWNNSAPHGAGRLMGRNEAKRKLNMNDFTKTMTDAGIYSTSVNMDTLDESPMAYKPLEEIVRNVEPTVEIKARIIPVYNFKAGGD